MDGFDPLTIAEDWLLNGRSIAIATVIETWGSAPRPAGSHLIVDSEGNFEGSVSGGCVEGAVIVAAMDVIEDGTARMLEFGVADETAWRVGLSCGGRIQVYLERMVWMDRALLRQINAERAARHAVIHLTDLEDGSGRIVRETEKIDGDLGDLIAASFRSGRSARAHVEGRPLFVNVYQPTARLVMIGAVHISQPLAIMAKAAGFAVVIIDPRTAFATQERFAGIDLVAEWPEDALKVHPLDRYTALAAVTHDPKIDDLPLSEALRVGCFYIGALGSRKTHAGRVARLKALGHAESDIARISAPIGLDIGATSPAEIAIAILADIVSHLRRPPRRDADA